MNKLKKNLIFLIFVASLFFLTSCDNSKKKDPYSSIKDIKNPTFRDFLKIQKHLKKDKREYLKLFSISSKRGAELLDKNYLKKAKEFRFVGKKRQMKPMYEELYYNTSKEDKKRCVICYTSFNKNYPDGIERLKKALTLIGYKGHFIYRIGSWPNLEENSLKYSHVLFAFKPFFFREVKNMGYENVLWVDSAVLPLQSLDTIFEKIEKNGYFGYKANFILSEYTNEFVLNLFDVTPKLANFIETKEAGILGLNLDSYIGNTILDRWQKAAENGGFYSARHDQNALSLIAYKLDLKKFEDSNVARPSEVEDITKDSVFFLDRSISYWPYKSQGEEKILRVTKKEKIKEKSFKDFFKLKTLKRSFLKNIKK
ncbi:MAG: hypothetical protein KR126chlam5_00900 [Candidatus Anoxychlamydiales bacterium]|nr:hypothetical protein [Candidatus Anoxychlamydiales bacterium]